MAGDIQSQEDELLALASIYSNKEIFSTSTDGDQRSGYFSAMLTLPDDFEIKASKKDESGQIVEMSHSVKYLPPIILYFSLPPQYPSIDPPSFTLSCQWLSMKQLSALCKKLDDIWTENQGFEVLFLWTSFLKDEALSFLNIRSPLEISSVKHQSHHNSLVSVVSHTSCDLHGIQSVNTVPALTERLYANTLLETDTKQYDSRAVQTIGSQDLLFHILLEYDKAQHHNVFLMTMFTCGVCFNEKLGSQCMKFSGCNHVYCNDCMTAYFKVQIAEGNVQCLVCPTANCQTEAHPFQVKELVGPELFSRYDQLLLQSSLDTMSDIMYCPRKLCGCPVMLDQDSTLGTCPSCHFAFCRFCRLAYHGVSPCRIKADDVRKLREEYLSATEEEKKQMERKYGRQCIKQVIQDSYSEEWLEENSKACPSCGSRIQKIDGCNKMTCLKCRCYFCWLCGAVLSHHNPYAHYSNPDSECFQRLFVGVAIEDDDEWEVFEPV